MTQWYEELFDQRYVDFYPALATGEPAEDDVDFIERALDLQPGLAILDLGCGQGRHAIPLAARGYEVTGLDLSEAMLERARRFAADHRVEIHWQRRRMEDLSGLGPFDACLCLYTVLGYYGDEGDLEVLRQVHARLRPGGQLLLDLSNWPAVLRRLPGDVWREVPTGVTRERHAYDPRTGFVLTDRKQFGKDGRQVILPRSAVRAYQPHEVIALLHRAGFEHEMIFGSYDDEPYQWDRSEHQIHVARRA